MTEPNWSPLARGRGYNGVGRRKRSLLTGLILLSSAILIDSHLSAAPHPDTAGPNAPAVLADSSHHAGADSTGPAGAADSVIQRLARQRTGESRPGRPLDLSYDKPDSVFSVKNISMVLIVIGLLVLFLHFLRKFLVRPLGGGSPGGQFQVIRRFHLGPKKAVTLVKFFDRLLLLGVTESSITTLAEIDDPDEVRRIMSEAPKPGEEQAAGFKNIYQSLLSRGKKTSQG
ncbi:MAG: flagellar biosynthetic protein FliO [Candidatus Glassbacteria bacterium]|nr:flagellar biosynthetic protein FliO [Candidatus Glassbacteria bacterium]